MTETKDELEQLLEREMELWTLGCIMGEGAHRDKVFNLSVTLFPSESDSWQYRNTFAAHIISIHGPPERTTREKAEKYAREYPVADGITIRRGDGSIIDWWSVNGS